MIMVTGYVEEIGDNGHGINEVVMDIGDVYMKLTHVSDSFAKAVAEYYGILITLTWCGAEPTIAVVNGLPPID